MKWKNLGIETGVYFITASIVEWENLFTIREACEILLCDMEFYRKKYNCKIHAYVIMPNHYHMIISLPKPELLSNWLRDFQSHTSHEFIKQKNPHISPNTAETFRKHANGKSSNCIWKEQARAIPIISRRF